MTVPVGLEDQDRSYDTRTLELPKVLEMLAAQTSFAAGRELALAIEPSNDLAEVERRLSETAEARELLTLQPTLTLGGARDIRGRDVGDPLPVDVGRGDPGVERERSDDRRLRRGVEALDVGGGIGLRIPEGLCLVECFHERCAATVHPVEDEVRCAVDDSQDTLHVVARQ